MSSYQRPNVPEITVQEDATDYTKMLTGLAAQIATRFLSNEMYNERRNQISNQAQEEKETNQKMASFVEGNDPLIMQDNVNQINQMLESGKDMDGNDLTDNSISFLESNLINMKNKIEDATSHRAAYLKSLDGLEEEVKSEFQNITQLNYAGYKNVEEIDKQIQEYQGYLATVEAQSKEFESQKIGTVQNILSKEDELDDKQSQIYQSKLFKAQEEKGDNLTDFERASIFAKHQGLEPPIETSGFYSPKEVAFKKRLNSYIKQLEEQKNMANIVNSWEQSLLQYGKNLTALKGDEKKYTGAATAYLKDLTNTLHENIHYMSDAHRKQLINFQDDITTMSKGYQFENLIDKIELDESFNHLESRQLLQIADRELNAGLTTGSKTDINAAINTLEKAIAKESLLDAQAIKQTKKEEKETIAAKKLHDAETKSLFKDQAKTTADFWKPGQEKHEITRALHSKFTDKESRQALDKNPSKYLTNFKGSEAEYAQAKVNIGRNISKLIIGSDLYDNKEVKELVDETMTGSGNFKKQDELFDMMWKRYEDDPEAGLNIDYIGTDRGADSDTAAKTMMAEYLKLYKVLRDRHISAIDTFGSQSGYGKLESGWGARNPFIDTSQTNPYSVQMQDIFDEVQKRAIGIEDD